MDKESFSDIGKVEAIRILLENSGAKGHTDSSFFSSKGSVVRTASRLWSEGIDFDLTYFPLKHLGYKCVIGTVGDIYAKLGKPVSMSVRLGISAKLDFPQVKELWEGISAAAKEHNIGKLDLDLLPSRNGLTISIVITGETDGETEAARKPASSKDLLCLSGNVGAAFLGMSLLEKGKSKFEKEGAGALDKDFDKYRMLIGAYLKPEIDSDIISRMKDADVTPSFGYAVSGGLADALRRVRRDTGLGVKVYTGKIPFEGNSFEAGKLLGIDPVSAAMNGGDDFRLLYVVPIQMYEKIRHDFQTFEIIGHLARPDVGTVIVTPEGAEMPVHAQGWPDEE